MELLFLAGMIGGLIALVSWSTRYASRGTSKAALEAAQSLSLARVALDPQSAGEALAIEPEEFLSEPEIYRGVLEGIGLTIAKVHIPSKTAVNGARIPIMLVKLVARLSPPIASTFALQRRVFGMPDNAKPLTKSFDEGCVVHAEGADDPIYNVLAPPALQRLVVELLRDAAGLGWIYGTHVETMVAHRDAAKVRTAARQIVRVARALGERGRALSEQPR